MKKNLWITSGIPGSGKSTWIRNIMNITDEGRSTVISCNDIRFELLGDSEDYFSKEDQVYKIFIENINAAVAEDDIFDIFVDATFLTRNSREKLLKHLNKDNIDINLVYFNVPLETCLNRNARKQGKAYVPPQTIKDMYKKLNYPSQEEINKYNYSIFWINEKGSVVAKR